MSARVDELAEMLGASYVGDGGKAISCVLPYDRATPESITFLARDRTVAKEGPCTAGAIIRARGCDPLDIPTLFVPEPL
jgi:UDP-3-O-[3-hydroxymyristoyl] glucosamine N-acyltransferase